MVTLTIARFKGRRLEDASSNLAVSVPAFPKTLFTLPDPLYVNRYAIDPQQDRPRRVKGVGKEDV